LERRLEVRVALKLVSIDRDEATFLCLVNRLDQLSMWHKEALYYESHLEGKSFITIFGFHLTSKKRCVVVNVYVPFI